MKKWPFWTKIRGEPVVECKIPAPRRAWGPMQTVPHLWSISLPIVLPHPKSLLFEDQPILEDVRWRGDW